MTTPTNIALHSAIPADIGARQPIRAAVKAVATEVTGWIEACADYYTAATLYEQLGKLSDAELRRRGLSRATLAADLAHLCDRTK